ncbi:MULTISPECIES: hypothetical protein [unclassified Microcoleus]|uniref:hypothetical protein n=1 Tax=unclassified Microcoleus TaxID=2642155 RepID=UPI002FD2825E
MDICVSFAPSIILLPDMKASEIMDGIAKIYQAAYAFRDFLDEKITESEWLEAVEMSGLDMDEYLKIAVLNSDLICSRIENHVGSFR